MPYIIEYQNPNLEGSMWHPMTKHRDLRTARRKVKYYPVIGTRIVYVSPDGKTREVIE